MKIISLKIFMTLLLGLMVSLFLIPGQAADAYYSQVLSASAWGKVSVFEDISYDPTTKIYTYTYTLNNLKEKDVWWWGIWYDNDPDAILDDSTVDEEGFAPTDLQDCSLGWKSTAPKQRMGFYILSGPNGELGFYSTYASDFKSKHTPTINVAIDSILGGQWGWRGEKADIITAYGIQQGETGYYVIESKKYFPGNKTFFYNTRDYWNSWYDSNAEEVVIGGFEFTSTTRRSGKVAMSLNYGYNLISQPFEGLLDPDTLTPVTYSASTLLETIPGCQKVIRFNPLSQRTESYLYWYDTPMGTDFTIAPGEGYYTEVSSQITFDLTGLIATEPQTLSLTSGYNSISLTYGPGMPTDRRTGYTSSNLLTAIPGCKSVVRFNPLSQKTESYRYWDGEPDGIEFDICVGEGYLVEVSDDIGWTPEKTALQRMRLRESLKPSLYFDLTLPVISEVRTSYQTAGSVTVSWLTDVDSQGEVHFSTQADLSQYYTAVDSHTGKVHRVELIGLQSGQGYYYEIQSGASIDDNNGQYYLYIPAQPSSPLDNLYIGGRVKKADESPLTEALVMVTVTHDGIASCPLSFLITRSSGIWYLNLADLKNSLTGDSLPYSLNDPVYLEVYGGDGWRGEDSTKLISDLTEDKGYSLTMSLPPSQQLAAPVFSPPSGTFIKQATVSISCATSGATIYYTTDGSEPTMSSPVYTSALTISKTATIKAKAFKNAYIPSETVTRTYSIEIEKVALPVISSSSATATFISPITVSITCATPGAIIYYTKDGSEPTASSLAYTAPLTISKTTTIKAKGFKSDCIPSDTASATYTRWEKVALPVILPSSPTFADTVTVSITCTTPSATIRYTTDGSEPTINSPVYTAALTLDKTTTIKAKGFKSDCTPSDTASATYSRGEKVALPVILPSSPTFTDTVTVSITCATPGAIIYYTKDGSEPTASSLAYTVPLTINKTTTIKAKGFKSKCIPSDTASATYSRGEKVALPSFHTLSPILTDCPIFATTLAVSIDCTTPLATIRYTTDGSEPTINSPVYTDTLHLNETTTIMAKGFKSNCIPSDTAITTYTRCEEISLPVILPSSPIFIDTMTVSIDCATLSATIRYTTDGGEPTINSPVYTGPLTLDRTTTIKARGFIDCFSGDSPDTASATYWKKVALPVISPPSHDFSGSVTVSIYCATPSATIRYTTDGNEPTEGSPVYTGPLTLDMGATIKAKGFEFDCIPSETASETYTRREEPPEEPLEPEIVALPVFSPSPYYDFNYDFSGSVTVSISCATPSATIRYTTDGSEPTEYSTVYTGPLELIDTTTIKARGFKSDCIPSCIPSETVSATYTRRHEEPIWPEEPEPEIVALPFIFPSSHTFTGTVTVSISCETPFATIRYTTDGSEPMEYSPVYTGPLTLDQTTTIKARGFKSDCYPSCIPSGTVSETYTRQYDTPYGWSYDPWSPGYYDPWSPSYYEPWPGSGSSYYDPWSTGYTDWGNYQQWSYGNTFDWNYQPWSSSFYTGWSY